MKELEVHRRSGSAGSVAAEGETAFHLSKSRSCEGNVCRSGVCVVGGGR